MHIDIIGVLMYEVNANEITKHFVLMILLSNNTLLLVNIESVV